MTVISPICIDLGAKNTGLYLSHYSEGEDPTNDQIDKDGKVIVIDGDKVTWSQQNRTSKRHQVRGSKRRKLAKRLLKVILNYEYGIDVSTLEKPLYEFIQGLLNNRGFTYLVEGLDEEKIKHPAVISYFTCNHPDFFSAPDHFFTDFINLTNEIDKSESLFKKLTLSKAELKKKLEEDKDAVADGYDNIKITLATQLKAEKEGHKHRSRYLKDIEKDIIASTLMAPLLEKAELTAKQFSNLIGHISNLQLRVLRKYFNSVKMDSGDQWDDKRLHLYFKNWILSWHCKQDDERARKKVLLSALAESSVLEVLTSQPADLSIPPYEDQNNRRPSKDMTLRLNPATLDLFLPEWEKITENLIANYQLPEELSPSDGVIKVNITESIVASTYTKHKADFEKQKLANIFQRILDRTSLLDPYKLRLLVLILKQQGDLSGISDHADSALTLLNKHTGNEALAIITLANRYYSEVGIAKQGLWQDISESLFYRSNTNPPHKNKILPRLCGHVLGEPLDQRELNNFISDCWKLKKIGRSTIGGLAKKAEELRKKHGNGFKHIGERQLWLDKQPDREVEDKAVLKIFKDSVDVSEILGDYFKHSESQKKIYANPFSLAQLSNLIESDLHGFSKTDRWNTEENGWRGQTEEYTVKSKSGKLEKKLIANGVRLVADSIRPFDGMLDRILTRQAKEIAQFKADQILRSKLKIEEDETLFIPLLMEQNRFKFEEDLADIKGKGKKRKEADAANQNQLQSWQDKDQRLKVASKGICPYTGQNIGTQGEVDHIIPRSASRKSNNTVFNSEANLIFCSGKGNHEKGDQRYTLHKLHPNYLNAVFGTANHDEISARVKATLNGINTDDFRYHLLDGKQQIDIKHALFFPELDAITFPMLNTRFKTLVNGTQGYLGKLIRQELLRKLSSYNVKIKTYQVNAQEVSNLRAVLSSQKQEFEKKEIQSAFSHVIDATLVFATALQNSEIADELATLNCTEVAESGDWLSKLMPSYTDFIKVDRKPKYRKELSSTQIFKEGLYAERFVPLLLTDTDLWAGFALDNCYKISNKRGVYSGPEEFFELLKPFLQFKKQEVKNDLKYWKEKAAEKASFVYFNIDKTKALSHLQENSQRVCGNLEIKQAKILENLRYCIQKKKITAQLLKGKSKKKFEKLNNKQLFEIGNGLVLPAKKDWELLVKAPIETREGWSTLAECFGKEEMVQVDNPDLPSNFIQELSGETKLDIPIIEAKFLKKDKDGKSISVITKAQFKDLIKKELELLPLMENEIVQGFLGKQISLTRPLISTENWEAFFVKYFNSGGNSYHHSTVRKEYSLPIKSDPSGGFRMERKTPLGESFFQLSEVEGFASQGYHIDSAGYVEFKKPVLIEGLASSENVAPAGNIESTLSDRNTAYFDEWRKIELSEGLLHDVISLFYAIGTKDRFYIKVEMTAQYFLKNIASTLEDSVEKVIQLRSEVKVIDKTIFSTKLGNLFGKPRSNLFIQNIGENITFWYIVDSTNSHMKSAYQKGVVK